MYRRKVVSIAILTLLLMFNTNLFAQKISKDVIKLNNEQHDHITHQMDIIPGLWRPMFKSEQVAWISPTWETHEYLWFDFPEGINVDGEFMYIGHLSKRFPTAFPMEKQAPWTEINKGISYEQMLPNGVSFGGEITKKEENVVALKLWITNGGTKELKKIMPLTCLYLDGMKEFNMKSNDNKLIHVPNKGWVPFEQTGGFPKVKNGVNVGWLDADVIAKGVADLPVVIVKSKIDGHLLALTWFEDTHSIIGNPNHPCVHADPLFNDLKPGQTQTINGELIFFEGSVDEFEKMFRKRLKK